MRSVVRWIAPARLPARISRRLRRARSWAWIPDRAWTRWASSRSQRHWAVARGIADVVRHAPPRQIPWRMRDRWRSGRWPCPRGPSILTLRAPWTRPSMDPRRHPTAVRRSSACRARQAGVRADEALWRGGRRCLARPGSRVRARHAATWPRQRPSLRASAVPRAACARMAPGDESVGTPRRLLAPVPTPPNLQAPQGPPRPAGHRVMRCWGNSNDATMTWAPWLEHPCARSWVPWRTVPAAATRRAHRWSSAAVQRRWDAMPAAACPAHRKDCIRANAARGRQRRRRAPPRRVCDRARRSWVTTPPWYSNPSYSML